MATDAHWSARWVLSVHTGLTCLQSCAQDVQFSPAVHLPSPQNGDFCRPAVEAAALGPEGAPSEAANGGRSGVTTVSSNVFCIARCDTGCEFAAVLGIRLDSPPQCKGRAVPHIPSGWQRNGLSTFCVARICRARCCVMISASVATALASADGAAAAGLPHMYVATAHSSAAAAWRGQGRTMWCN